MAANKQRLYACLRAPGIRNLSSLLLGLTLVGCAVHPSAFDNSQNQARADDLIARANANQEPINCPIDLYQAMARAIKYNLDSRVELMNTALAQRELDLQHYDLLPKLVASLDYSGRNNDAGASSRSLLTGQTSLEPSTSSDRDVLDSNLQLSWDVLDFGLSYIRAKQAADQVSIAKERKRKVINQMIEDVRTAYWRAVSAQRMLGKLEELQHSTQQALDLASQQEQAGLTAPLAPLSYERELLGIQRDIQALGGELGVAKQQLAALMNLAPNTAYDVALPADSSPWQPLSLPGVDNNDPAAWLRLAIENRPELREVAYQLRSNQSENTAALLRTLPNLKLFVGLNSSSNSYLYNNNWVSWGAQTSWNLLNVFRLPAERAKVQATGQVLDARQLALTTAVATQLEVSRARYALRRQELDTAQRYYQVQERIQGQIEAGYQAQKLSRQALIREQMNSLVARVRYDIAQADLQNAYANVFASLGIDPVDASMRSSDSVSALTAKLRSLWNQRQEQVTPLASGPLMLPASSLPLASGPTSSENYHE
ncbi:TolC family protein [Pseudomonas sp. NFXW11]|uniref:TolC family protein n=1 Tax=Pseudomonas sp. NFXW11 TaxID=2819531 RepID=UPI003CF700F5